MLKTHDVSSTKEIRELGTFQRVQLKPGDKIVLTCDGYMSAETAERIRGYVERWAPGVPVLVLSDGLRFGVVGVE